MGRGPLTSDQIAFFKDAGFLLLKDMLDPRLCGRAIDRLWRTLPPGSRMKRENPSTHFGPFPPDEESDDPLHIRRGYLWQLRECGTEPLLIELAYNANMCAVAEQLLGKGMLATPTVNDRPMGSTAAIGLRKCGTRTAAIPPNSPTPCALNGRSLLPDREF